MQCISGTTGTRQSVALAGLWMETIVSFTFYHHVTQAFPLDLHSETESLFIYLWVGIIVP